MDNKTQPSQNYVKILHPTTKQDFSDRSDSKALGMQGVFDNLWREKILPSDYMDYKCKTIRIMMKIYIKKEC